MRIASRLRSPSATTLIHSATATATLMSTLPVTATIVVYPQPPDVPHLSARFAAPIGERVHLLGGRRDLRRRAERARRRRDNGRRFVAIARRLHVRGVSVTGGATAAGA